jgi:malate/lactate dehydrogenase
VEVAILGGAGGVGASAAFNLLLRPEEFDVVLVDPRDAMVQSHVMDLEQVLELSPGGSIRAGGPAEVGAADVIVVASSVPLTVNTSRLVYLAGNAGVVDEVANLLPDGWPGVLLVVTNPVDPFVTRVRRRTGIDRARVVGYTVNDSLRLRTGLAKALGLPLGNVEAWVVGEHGDTSVPLYDRVTVNGERVEPTPEQTAEADEFIRTFYVRHVALDSGRSSTWTSGLGISRMVAALRGEGELWPASVVLDGEYGISGVAVSVPVTLGQGGVSRIHEWDLGPEELAALRASAEFVREIADGIDQPVARREGARPR